MGLGSIFADICYGIGQILAAILPGLIEEWKKPREVKQVGHSDDLQKSLEDSVADSVGVRPPGMRRDSAGEAEQASGRGDARD